MGEEELGQPAQQYKLDEKLMKDLSSQMKSRHCSFEEDMKSLRDMLDGAQHPADIVRSVIHKMEIGRFGHQAASPRSRSRSPGGSRTTLARPRSDKTKFARPQTLLV